MTSERDASRDVKNMFFAFEIFHEIFHFLKKFFLTFHTTRYCTTMQENKTFVAINTVHGLMMGKATIIILRVIYATLE